MELCSDEILLDKNEGSLSNEVAESVQPKMDISEEWKQEPGSLVDIVQVKKADSKSSANAAQTVADVFSLHLLHLFSIKTLTVQGYKSVVLTDRGAPGEVNMEASITADDVMRAGGFGARDDISSFLPVASDSTDFEASLRDARDYEDPLEEICRPGLGWTETTK